MDNKITEVTRQEIIDLFVAGHHDDETDEDIQCYWHGKLDEPAFLSRLYNLQSMTSADSRYRDAYGDVHQHRVNNSDWDDDWVFYDSRFAIKTVSDKEWLRFISESFHPSVRDERVQWKKILDMINKLLRIDGYELYEDSHISGRHKYNGRKSTEHCISVLIPERQPTYELKLIGEGSYACVFKYMDAFYKTSFIVKRAKKELSSKEIDRFKREFEEMKKLSSPYIVEVYCYDVAANEYIMEFMDFSLDKYIEKFNSTLTAQQRKGLGLQILKAFEYIHAKGLLHRDISPKNVLIKKYDDVLIVKIADFGLVKIPDSTLTSLNTEYKGYFNDPVLRLEGFDSYNMAHEIYALTHLLYFVMTGKTNTDKVDEPKLKAFVEKGMAPDKSKRYVDIADIGTSFRKL